MKKQVKKKEKRLSRWVYVLIMILGIAILKTIMSGK
jgi:hypothetical protein